MAQDDVTALLEEEFDFSSFTAATGRPQVPLEAMVLEVHELTAEDAKLAAEHVESGVSLGVTGKVLDIKTMRHSHHRCAQLLAGGMENTQAASLCGFNTNYVGQLRSSPAFQELLSIYKQQVDAEFTDFVTAAAALSMDLLDHLRQQLDEHPERFTIDQTRQALSMLADRTGHAPVTKSVQVNVNGDAALRLARARERARNAATTAPHTIEGTARAIGN